LFVCFVCLFCTVKYKKNVCFFYADYIKMDFVYVLVYDGSELEDIIILLSKEDAINESINQPNSRVEIFSKNTKLGYTPTYNYYKNGELIQNAH